MTTSDTAPPTVRKAYSYVRFSTPEQSKGDSAGRQIRMAKAYAAKHGLELDERLTFHDVGVSAYRGRNAEAGKLAYFVEAVDAGLVEQGAYLLVEQLDRISRLAPRKALRVLEDIVDAGVTVVTLNDGRQYSNVSMDKDQLDLIISILTFTRAHEESATKSSRLKESWMTKRADSGTKPMTSVVPAWLRFDKKAGRIEAIPVRAAVVARIFEMTLLGVGQHKIAETLNVEGVKPWGRGGHWHRSYIAKILQNPAVIGSFAPHVMEYEGTKKARRALQPLQGYYPAVVSDAAYAEVQALRTAGAASRGRHATNVISNVLAGLAKCALCGRTMTRTNKGKRSLPAYVCTAAKAGAGCAYRSVRYAWVDMAIRERLASHLGDIPTVDADGDIMGKIRGAEEWADELREIGRELLDPDTPAPADGRGPALVKVEARLRAAEAQLAELLEQRDASSGPLISSRVDALVNSLGSPSADTAAINLAMRRVFGQVIIHTEPRILELQYIHGGECRLGY